MFRTFAATSLLTLACVMPVQQAAAQDAIGGAIFGGAAGAILGGAIGGRGGAVAGAHHRRHHRRGDRRRRPAPPRRLLLVSQRLLHAASGWRLRGRRAAVLRRPGYGPPPAAYGPPPAYGPPGYGRRLTAGPATVRRLPPPSMTTTRSRWSRPAPRAVERRCGCGLRAQISLLRSAQRHVPVARRHAQALPVKGRRAREATQDFQQYFSSVPLRARSARYFAAFAASCR